MGANDERKVCIELGSLLLELYTGAIALNAYSFFRLEKRRQAMLEMPKMIADWKQRGHGRGWKKWPK
jgi:hypothetical protein